MNKKIKISALVLILCIGATIFTSCGNNKDTTHDAGSDGQVTTEQKNERPNGKPDLPQTEENSNGVIGEAVTDVTRGARDIVGGVAEGTRDIVGGAMGSNMNNGTTTTPHSANGGMPGGAVDNGVAKTRTMPRNGK